MLDGQEDAGEAEVDDPPPVIGGVIDDHPERTGAGIGNGDVEATQVGGQVRCGLDRPFVGDVAHRCPKAIAVSCGKVVETG